MRTLLVGAGEAAALVLGLAGLLAWIVLVAAVMGTL